MPTQEIECLSSPGLARTKKPLKRLLRRELGFGLQRANTREDEASAIGIDLDAPLSYEKDAKRTVYLPVARNNPSGELALFDGANPDLVTGRRNDTTVPTQALYLLNSAFLLKEAKGVAKSAMKSGALPGTEVDQLYRTLLGRAPDPVERERAMGLVADLSGGGEELSQVEEAVGHLAHLLMASTEFLYLE